MDKRPILLLFLISFLLYGFSPFSGVKQTLVEEYDVIVVGAGTGGISAAIQAARTGSTVLLLEETDWIGGQMTAAAVSTMDGNYGAWESGIYKEFIDKVKLYYSSRGISIGGCYYSSSTYCFEPHVASAILSEMILSESNITLRKTETVTSVYTVNGIIESVTTLSSDGYKTIIPKIVIDATEYGDIISMSGASYRISNQTSAAIGQTLCVQDITYTAVMKAYVSGIPEELRITTPPPGYTATVENDFKSVISNKGYTYWAGLYPITWDTHNSYRYIPDSSSTRIPGAITKTEINLANDYVRENFFSPTQRLSSQYLYDLSFRQESNCMAKLKTIQFIYFVQNVLGRSWSVSTDEGYNTEYNRQHACSNIPASLKTIEYNLPVMAYVRESKRGIGLVTVTGKDIYRVGTPVRAQNMFSSGIAIGNYATDIHNCDMTDSYDLQDTFSDKSAEGGPFRIPLGALISVDVSNLLFAEKNISVSRLANGATRLQPITMLTGQAAGALASISITKNIPPASVSYKEVQFELIKWNDMIIPFTDGNVTYPYFKDVQYMAARGIMNGYSNLTFGVNDLLTREQMAVILVRSFNIPIPPATGIFSDVPTSSVYAPYIEALYNSGITSGCSASPKLYCPQGYVTNEQMAIFSLRGWKMINPSITEINSQIPHYTDVPQGYWAYIYIEGLQFNGVTHYCQVNKFCPTANIKRGESAHILNQILLHENQ